MSDSTEKLQQELQAAQRTVAELQAKLESRETTHRLTTLELEENRSALLFMLEDLEAARKKIEQAHREWMAALDVIADPIFLHDKKFRILRCNKAYQRCAGIPFHEIIGRPYYEIFPKVDTPLPCCLQAVGKAEAEEDVVVGGTIYRSRAFSINDEQGAYLYSVHTLEDITESRRAEAVLHESEEKFRNISESAQDAIIMMGADQCISFWNAAAERIFDYTATEIIGKELHALIVPAAAHAKFTQAFPHFQSTGDGPIIGKVVEVTALRKGGEEFPVELSISPTQLNGQWHAIGIVRDITERKQAEAAIGHANRALAALSAVNRSLVRASSEDELLQLICHAIVHQRGYRMAWVGYVQHDESQSIRIMARAGHDEGYLDAMQLTWAETERGLGPTGRAVRSGATQLCQDIANDPLYLPWRDAALKHGYAASIGLPLLNGDNTVFGILNVYAEEVNAFTPYEIDLLEEMAGDLAFGVRSLHTRHERDLALVKNQEQLVQLQDSLEDTVRAIATIVEMRDPYTAGHQIRVADLAMTIARQMGLPDEQIHAIHLAGIVHDLGKIQIPAEILSKPGKITDIEYSLIKVHPQAGYDILKGIDFPWPIAQMVLQHHERLDGSGYPQGLKGDAILLEARILSVADVVEAISAHRPYRPGLGIDIALGEITRNRGIFYDPQVVDACLTLFREQGYTFK